MVIKLYLLGIIVFGSSILTYGMENNGGGSLTLAINSNGEFLEISIPNDFVGVNNSDGKLKLTNEFEKKVSDASSQWIERITTHVYVNTNSQKVVLQLKEAIKKLASDVKVKYISSEHLPSLSCLVTVIITYTKQDKKRVVYARFINEWMQPVTVGFKYTIDATNKNEKEIIKQLKKYAEEQTRIVYYGKGRKK